ncbi:hypothetical protein ETAA8_04440 [Anatilimnocola aggregata]|uniref:Uncharacterized protein n=2 Tax=Anatilimnocola aggregata TaxID=2528021 RepID=A0A517Y565_9BACT|nr:hypothetical protein ETAA8_04440 [Anatilimnocola aggregata]
MPPRMANKKKPVQEEVPTPFLSPSQLQAIEAMWVNHASEAGDADELTIVEETDDERLLRMHREEMEAAKAARDYPEDVEDVMEAVLRHRFKQEFAGGQPCTEGLSILDRCPSEKFLKRFAGEAVAFQFGYLKDRRMSYEIYQWKMTPPDRAVCWLAQHDSGSMCIDAYVLSRKEEHWHVATVQTVLYACGVVVDVPQINPNSKLRPALRLLLRE